MSYEAWRITYQDSERAARAAYATVAAQAQALERMRAALTEAEEYIAQHSQADGYGLRDHDHDRYERAPLLERLRAALSAAPPASPPADTRKPCTCDGAGRGPGRPCVVKAGGSLGELWRCAEGASPPAATPAAAPQIAAKPLEWERDDARNEWSDKHCGFFITFHDDGDDTPYTASWGDDDAELFQTLDDAKAWCQRRIDAWVREVAAVAPAAAQEAPRVGETWHILRPGAWACSTVKIKEITAHTVQFEPEYCGSDGERLPLDTGLRFVDRAAPREQTP